MYITPPCNRKGTPCEKRSMSCRSSCNAWKLYQCTKTALEAKKDEYRKLVALAEKEDRADRNKERREKERARKAYRDKMIELYGESWVLGG